MTIDRPTVNLWQTVFDGAEDNPNAIIEPDTLKFTNNDCSLYFETDVIVDLLKQGEHRKSDYMGLVSPTFRHKLAHYSWYAKDFSVDSLSIHCKHYQPNVCNLMGGKVQNPFKHGEVFHPGILNLFSSLVSRIPGYADVDIDRRWTISPIWCNFFVADTATWEDYSQTLLFPALDLVEQDEDLRNSLLQSTTYGDNKMPQKLQDKYGVVSYPFLPFVFERLINLYLAVRPDIKYTCWGKKPQPDIPAGWANDYDWFQDRVKFPPKQNPTRPPKALLAEHRRRIKQAKKLKN